MNKTFRVQTEKFAGQTRPECPKRSLNVYRMTRCVVDMARRRRKSSASGPMPLIGESSSSLPVPKSSAPSSVLCCLSPLPNSVSKPDTAAENRLALIMQIFLVFGIILFSLYTCVCFDHFHWHLTRFYATHLDDHHAQHTMGHKLISQRSHPEAFQWFRRSADSGHAHSAYNLAVGHLSGYRTDVRPGEVRQLLRFAAKNGVNEAKELLRGLCREKPKHCDM